jgi:hypothetical protein
MQFQGSAAFWNGDYAFPDLRRRSAYALIEFSPVQQYTQVSPETFAATQLGNDGGWIKVDVQCGA